MAMQEAIDMLVRLYALPPVQPLLTKLDAQKITIRRPRAYEKDMVICWVERQFSRGWAGECDVCFSQMPISAHIATHDGDIVGFSCHETTYKNFFGPVGVLERFRNKGLGRCLLLSSLHAMRDMGYAYAIIGGPTIAVSFYRQAVGATAIEVSSPGIYVDRLKGADS
jgi:GNAT superfamily N-acetyltransferase